MTGIFLRCGHDRCPYIGKMKIEQTSPGIAAGGLNPPEPATFTARCPKCRWERDVDDDFKPCDHCGVEDQPELLMDIDGDLLCVWCRHDEYERKLNLIAKRKEVTS